MTRAPYVMGKAETAFARTAKLEDTSLGWRFINPAMQALYGVDTMPQTAEAVAKQFQVSRADQDAFAARSQARAKAAQDSGYFAEEIVAVEVKDAKGRNIPTVIATPIDEAAKQILAASERSDQDRVLHAIYEHPGTSSNELAQGLDWGAHSHDDLRRTVRPSCSWAATRRRYSQSQNRSAIAPGRLGVMCAHRSRCAVPLPRSPSDIRGSTYWSTMRRCTSRSWSRKRLTIRS